MATPASTVSVVATAATVTRPQPGATRNQEATIYVGNLDEKVNDSLLTELFIQIAPVIHAHIPRDRITQQHQGYGFVELPSEADAEYAVKVMTGIRLYGKPLRINRSTADRKNLDVGANLFVGNLAPEVDEKMLFDTFILFGTLIQTPKVSREEATGASKGYAFLAYDCFEASDAAIEAMNGQFLANRPITVNYAYKKDSKGERHGTAAERLLAAQARRAGLTSAGLAPSQFAMQQLQASSMPTPVTASNNPILASTQAPMMAQPVGPYMAPPMVHPMGMPIGGTMPPFLPPGPAIGFMPTAPGVPYYGISPYYGMTMPVAPGTYPQNIPSRDPTSPTLPSSRVTK